MIETLKKHFGYERFRPLQEDVIRHLLGGGDALVLMPTGGGKSVCYQLTALLLPGVTIVVSPLISLMKDQVDALCANGIPAATINSQHSETENLLTQQKCLQGRIKLLYMSPERLVLDARSWMQDLRISLIAIDEAHCVSKWGHDFRPEYAQLHVLRGLFEKTPFVALTATADKMTREDIVKQLDLRSPRLFISSFDRPNLSLNVKRNLSAREKNRMIAGYIKTHPHDCGIIYCISRKKAEEVAQMLLLQDIKAAVYHAGLSKEQRDRAQDDFINDRVQVVCATVAFGMGIDKSNVRWVVHYNMPDSIESFYQEIGRAGRDGMPANTVLFFSMGDWMIRKHFADESGQPEINNEKLTRMKQYAEAGVCRRRILLNYFGEANACDCRNCDNCLSPPRKFDGTVLVQKALSGIMRTRQQVGLYALIDILRGRLTQEVREKRYDTLKTFGVGRECPERDWRDYLLQMYQLGYCEIDYSHHNHLKITPSGMDVLYGRANAWLAAIEPQPDESPKKRGRKKKDSQSALPLDVGDSDTLFEALRGLRKQLADGEGVPPYVVMSDKVLHLVSMSRPVTIEEFGQVNGIGDYKMRKYGQAVTRLVRAYVRQE